MRSHYRFGHAWHVAAAPERVRALVEDVGRYGEWWPAVRVLRGGGAPGSRTAEAVIAAPLGYALRIRLAEAAPRGDELRAAIAGDLEGWCAWWLVPRGDGTAVRFAQEVEVRAPLLRLASPLAHRALARQHGAVLRAAADGMRAALA